MKKVYIIAAITALICGGVIFGIFRAQKMENEEARIEAEEIAKEREAATTSIVTANTDIKKGETIREDMLSEISVDRAILISLDAVTDINSVAGRTASKDIAAGEAITHENIRTDSDRAVSDDIPEGMVAVQIPADNDNAVAEHIEEGDHIDILTAVKSEAKGQAASSDTASNTTTVKTEWEILSRDVLVIRLGDRLYAGETDGDTARSYYSYVIVAADEQTAVKILNAISNSEVKMLLNSKAEE